MIVIIFIIAALVLVCVIGSAALSGGDQRTSAPSRAEVREAQRREAARLEQPDLSSCRGVNEYGEFIDEDSQRATPSSGSSHRGVNEYGEFIDE